MKYPKGTKINNNKHFPKSSNARGMALEHDINLTNKYYIENDIALIYKKPTPVKVTKVDFPNTKGKKITDGFFEIPSTTDYNGVYNGVYIDFEAKETKSKTSFPLSNIHPHQLVHLERVTRHKGISFIIVRFRDLDETYLLMESDLTNYIKNNTKKSIPLSYFKTYGHIIDTKYIPRLDYLKVLEKLEIFGGNHEKK